MAKKKQFVLVFASDENGYEGETREFETEQEMKDAVDAYFKEEAESGKEDDWEGEFGDYKEDIVSEYNENEWGYQEFADAKGYNVFLGIAKRSSKSELEDYVEDLRTQFEDEF